MAAVLLLVLPVLASCSNDGNIHLLEEDIAIALRNCYLNHEVKQTKEAKRQRRTSDDYEDPLPRIDSQINPEINQYDHERRNTTYKMHVLNNSSGYPDYGIRDGEEKLINLKPTSHGNKMHNASTYNRYINSTRVKRNEPLMNKDDNDQCLSQCVFANLQVVDSRGIPREAELWNKIQTAVTSQQSRTLLKDQIHSCFQELQSESEDNGCYYSSKLESCLMLRFSDRIRNTEPRS
ncbi:uncharacterized protein LOC112049039 [Bicyclus anynana]|uniref:Uncharacterized protein LOC112049039 n=1 Tax=Bicyclus anynana TaxID=110368 RepID=A0A6J1NBY5_BICAN|nr:uncharacterized protein LOC112049039 [Bicyclus anynana]